MAGVVLACLGAGFASAQGRPAGAGGGATPARALPAAREEASQAEATLAQISAARVTVRKQLEQARAEKDVVKSLCLNDKLSQLDVAVRSAEERKAAVLAAANRQDRELMRHEATILAVLKQRTEQLVNESNQCIGREAGMVGESAVSSAIDPNLPQEESPGANPAPIVPSIVVQPPGCASCFE